MNAPSPADIKANRSDDPYIHCLAGEVRTRIEDGEDDESIPDSAIGACRTTLEEMAETLMPNPDLEGRVSTQDNYELQNRFDSDREKLMDERERMSLGQLQTMVAEYRRRGGR